MDRCGICRMWKMVWSRLELSSGRDEATPAAILQLSDSQTVMGRGALLPQPIHLLTLPHTHAHRFHADTVYPQIRHVCCLTLTTGVNTLTRTHSLPHFEVGSVNVALGPTLQQQRPLVF